MQLRFDNDSLLCLGVGAGASLGGGVLPKKGVRGGLGRGGSDTPLHTMLLNLSEIEWLV